MEEFFYARVKPGVDRMEFNTLMVESITIFIR